MIMHLKKNGLAYLSLMLAQFTVGVNIVGSKYLLPVMPESMILFFRFAFATSLLLVLYFISKKKNRSFVKEIQCLTSTDWKYLIAQALCAGILFNLLLLWGLQYTDAYIAGIITSALPAIITIFSAIFLHERLKVFNGLCVIFAVLGLVLINFSDFHFDNRKELLGAFIVFLALIPEATYYLLVKKHVVRMPLLLISAVINFINVPILYCILVFGGHHVWSFSSLQWSILVAVALSSGIFYVLWNWGAQVVRGITSALFTAFMPIATLLIAAIFLGESISFLQFFGMILVLISIVLNACA